ncbi:hypothetical protein QWJ90_01465 [Microbacterium oryzae]|uniref:hypothetical protein n=1 Tax=Microbacterium oryzae TaxID=743009 RepID=UPI0025B1CB14|nr:hypothetical protein [Microbacterium oryzae]MDN3309591.1 hypothetical protein [Microbacterium oryzae]
MLPARTFDPGPAILSQITGDDARARRSDPGTSHAAADSISAEHLEASEQEVLTILAAADEPLTDQAIAKRHVQRAWQLDGVPLWTDERMRTARAQLTKKGAVVQDGHGKTEKGRRAMAWRLAGTETA